MSRLCRTAALAGLAGALLAAPGCLGHHDPVAPHVSASPLRMIWPNEDGRSWSYQVVERSFADGSITIYGNPAAVPPAPSISQAAALLDTLPIGTVIGSDTASFGLRFSGLITTQSGVTRQNLFETLVSTSATSPARTPIGGSPAFLAQLYRARPDLRPLLRARFASVSQLADTVHTYASTLLHGYAWEKTTRWIGTYGDVDTLLAWKFLTSNLLPGSEFTHQLVPSLASDVFLHGRILERQTVRTPAGTYVNAVVCAYLIDFGISQLTGAGGTVTGYSRWYNYGSVAYVDGVGPVACYERRMLTVGSRSTGVGDVALRLTGTGPGLLSADRP